MSVELSAEPLWRQIAASASGTGELECPLHASHFRRLRDDTTARLLAPDHAAVQLATAAFCSQPACNWEATRAATAILRRCEAAGAPHAVTASVAHALIARVECGGAVPFGTWLWNARVKAVSALLRYAANRGEVSPVAIVADDELQHLQPCLERHIAASTASLSCDPATLSSTGEQQAIVAFFLGAPLPASLDVESVSGCCISSGRPAGAPPCAEGGVCTYSPLALSRLLPLWAWRHAADLHARVGLRSGLSTAAASGATACLAKADAGRDSLAAVARVGASVSRAAAVAGAAALPAALRASTDALQLAAAAGICAAFADTCTVSAPDRSAEPRGTEVTLLRCLLHAASASDSSMLSLLEGLLHAYAALQSLLPAERSEHPASTTADHLFQQLCDPAVVLVALLSMWQFETSTAIDVLLEEATQAQHSLRRVLASCCSYACTHPDAVAKACADADSVLAADEDGLGIATSDTTRDAAADDVDDDGAVTAVSGGAGSDVAGSTLEAVVHCLRRLARSLRASFPFSFAMLARTADAAANALNPMPA